MKGLVRYNILCNDKLLIPKSLPHHLKIFQLSYWKSMWKHQRLHCWGYTSLNVIGGQRLVTNARFLPVSSSMSSCNPGFLVLQPSVPVEALPCSCPLALSSTDVSSQLMGWWFSYTCSTTALLRHPSLAGILVFPQSGLQSWFGLCNVNLAAAAGDMTYVQCTTLDCVSMASVSFTLE